MVLLGGYIEQDLRTGHFEIRMDDRKKHLENTIKV